jgi:hypothetical protein
MTAPHPAPDGEAVDELDKAAAEVLAYAAAIVWLQSRPSCGRRLYRARQSAMSGEAKLYSRELRRRQTEQPGEIGGGFGVRPGCVCQTPPMGTDAIDNAAQVGLVPATRSGEATAASSCGPS